MTTDGKFVRFGDASNQCIVEVVRKKKWGKASGDVIVLDTIR